MNIKALISNASFAFLAQGVAAVMSCLTSLLVPKVLGVTEYGYWQLFTFYSSYVGFFHLGLNDGIYLVHGGKTRDAIDKKLVNSQFLFGVVFQSGMAVLIVCAVLMTDFDGSRSFVITATAFYMVIENAALYLGFVFQAMNETKLYSVSCILERLVFFIPLIVLLVTGNTHFEPYVTARLVSTCCQFLFCAWHAKDFFASGLMPIGCTVVEWWGSVRVGIRLTLANIASQLVLGIARFVIDLVWGIETFGKLSLSLSMVTFVLSFVSQAAMVLFPALRQSGKGEIRAFFRYALDIMGIVFPAIYLLYFPGVWLLELWLPDYAESFIFFAYLLPVCVFDSKMNIACTTYFKVNRKENELFKINVATMALSAAGTFVGAYLAKSVFVIIGAVTMAIVARSIYSECRISKAENYRVNLRVMFGELIITAVFIVAVSFLSDSLAIAAYVLVYVIFLFVNRDSAKGVVKKLRRARRL